MKSHHVYKADEYTTLSDGVNLMNLDMDMHVSHARARSGRGSMYMYTHSYTRLTGGCDLCHNGVELLWGLYCSA